MIIYLFKKKNYVSIFYPDNSGQFSYHLQATLGFLNYLYKTNWYKVM